MDFSFFYQNYFDCFFVWIMRYIYYLSRNHTDRQMFHFLTTSSVATTCRLSIFCLCCCCRCRLVVVVERKFRNFSNRGILKSVGIHYKCLQLNYISITSPLQLKRCRVQLVAVKEY